MSWGAKVCAGGDTSESLLCGRSSLRGLTWGLQEIRDVAPQSRPNLSRTWMCYSSKTGSDPGEHVWFMWLSTLAGAAQRKALESILCEAVEKPSLSWKIGAHFVLTASIEAAPRTLPLRFASLWHVQGGAAGYIFLPCSLAVSKKAKSPNGSVGKLVNGRLMKNMC